MCCSYELMMICLRYFQTASSESDVILELFRVVDELCEGDANSQEKALDILRKNESDVRRNE